MTTFRYLALVATGVLIASFAASAQNRQVNPEVKQFRYSTTIEKERPELNEATKARIAAYRRNPSQENYDALLQQVEANYDAVLARKQAKLEELRRTARDQYKVDEMQEIVDEVIADREHRVAQTMARFTDPRMRPGARDNKDGFLPLIGGGHNVWVAYAPVTNKEYAAFDRSYSFKAGQENYPAVNVSYEEAVRFCAWKSEKDGKKYRLPSEDEWETAAGHMPKDADFNCGAGDGLSAVDAYAGTLGASGGIDFWGNCWEWTSTFRPDGNLAVKGGGWDSPRMSCRTEYRAEGRTPDVQYANVGFRLIRED